MSSSREKCFKSKVIQSLYQKDDSSDEERSGTQSSESIEKVLLTKRKSASQENTTDVDWPFSIPKLQKVCTVKVNPEDLQKVASSSASSSSNQKEESTAEREKRIAKNRKRKLKKKGKKQREQQHKSSSNSATRSEFTY